MIHFYGLCLESTERSPAIKLQTVYLIISIIFKYSLVKQKMHEYVFFVMLFL